MRLYHGSNIQNLKVLSAEFNTSKHLNTKDKFIYFSNDKAFAACYGTEWYNKTARQGYFNGELTFGISDKLEMNSPCSVYTVDIDRHSKDLEQINEHEFIWKGKTCKVIKEEKFKTFYDLLLKQKIKVISYNEYENKLKSFNSKVM